MDYDGVLPRGQHVVCPFCSQKFAVGDNGWKEISSEELAFALETCRHDPLLNKYYSQAPAGARLFIALVFWGRVFKDRVDPRNYLAAFSEIEMEMNEEDFRYLLRHETDAELAAYFRAKAELKAAVAAPEKVVANALPLAGLLRSEPVRPEQITRVEAVREKPAEILHATVLRAPTAVATPPAENDPPPAPALSLPLRIALGVAALCAIAALALVLTGRAGA